MQKPIYTRDLLQTIRQDLVDGIRKVPDGTNIGDLIEALKGLSRLQSKIDIILTMFPYGREMNSDMDDIYRALLEIAGRG